MNRSGHKPDAAVVSLSILTVNSRLGNNINQFCTCSVLPSVRLYLFYKALFTNLFTEAVYMPIKV